MKIKSSLRAWLYFPIFWTAFALAADAIDEEILKDLNFYSSLEISEFLSIAEDAPKELSVEEKSHENK
ncbi:MAG: hypothetical protein A3K03_10830 [Bdellovibrionales bacterium RIFOXYD1_FULL_44_7]|nr:MAG: hypothetical protein A3K03_10830 [Bdellovibrionales bacterium RIFOXYD1_FULL_44_7]